MADNQSQAIFQPFIPKRLINDEDRRLIEAFGISIVPHGEEQVYLYADDWATTGHVENDGKESTLSEDDLYGCLQEIIRRSNGELTWMSRETAYTSSEMNPDGFGGSAIFITADEVQYFGTSSWLEQKIEELDARAAEPLAGEPSWLEQTSIKAEEESLTANDILLYLIETFPQADPESEFYNEGIDGCNAVDFISEIGPKIRKVLDKHDVNEGRALGVLEAAWDFIENVLEDDPERNEKFFALREKVRNVFWERGIDEPILAVTIEGGVVQAVVSDYPEFLPSMNVVVIDYDTRGMQVSEMIRVPQEDGSISTADVTVHEINKARINLTAVLDQVDFRIESLGAGHEKEVLCDSIPENRC
jgi:hypothetical protein